MNSRGGLPHHMQQLEIQKVGVNEGVGVHVILRTVMLRQEDERDTTDLVRTPSPLGPPPQLPSSPQLLPKTQSSRRRAHRHSKSRSTEPFVPPLHFPVPGEPAPAALQKSLRTPIVPSPPEWLWASPPATPLTAKRGASIPLVLTVYDCRTSTGQVGCRRDVALYVHSGRSDFLSVCCNRLHVGCTVHVLVFVFASYVERCTHPSCIVGYPHSAAKLNNRAFCELALSPSLPPQQAQPNPSCDGSVSVSNHNPLLKLQLMIWEGTHQAPPEEPPTVLGSSATLAFRGGKERPESPLSVASSESWQTGQPGQVQMACVLGGGGVQRFIDIPVLLFSV